MRSKVLTALAAGALLACDPPAEQAPAAPTPAAAAPAPTKPPPAPEVLTQARAEEVFARIAAEVDCTASGFRWLCAAKEPTTPTAAPDATRVLLGVVSAFRPSMPIEVGAKKTTTVGTLALEANSDHTVRAGLSVLMPDPSLSVDLLIAAAGPVAGLIKGELDELVLPRAVLKLRDRPQPDMGFVTVDEHGPWVAADKPVRLFHIDDDGHGTPLWIAVQAIDQGGFVGVFPDVEPKVLVKPNEAEGAAPEEPPTSTPATP